MSLNFSEFSCL